MADHSAGWHADLCSKRSHDGGRTWGNFTMLAVNGSQPSMVYDTAHETIVLNFNLDRTGNWPHSGRNFQMFSHDAGASWSPKTPLPTNAALGQTAGPGVGLQLSHGQRKGRLLNIGWRNGKVGT